MMNYSRGLPRGVLWALSIVLIVLALLISLGRQLFPIIAEYREDIAVQVQSVLGVPVYIGQLEGSWVGFLPRLVAQEVRLGTEGQELRLGEVEATLDIIASLKARKLLLGQVNFSKLKLGLQEDEQGAWYVQGMSRDAPPTPVADVLRILQHLPSISLRDSQLSLQAFGEPERVLDQMELSLMAEPGQEGWQLQATGLVAVGQPLSLNVTLHTTPDTWPQARLKAYLKLPSYDWASWIPKRLTGAWKLQHIQAGAELWVEGQLQQQMQAALRVQAPSIAVSYAEGATTVFKNVSTTLHWKQTEGQQNQILLDQLRLTQGTQVWKPMQLGAESFPVGSGQQGWRVQLDTLEVNALAGLLEQLVPLSVDQQQLLKDLHPKGLVRHLNLLVDPSQPEAKHLQYAANLERVSFSHHGWIPAAGNVSGSIRGDAAQGALSFDSPEFSLHLSELFPQAWHYRQAKGRLEWKIDDQAVTLIAPLIQLEGEEGKIAGDFLIRLYDDPKAESYMDLRVGMHDGDSRFAGRYLPTQSPALSKDLVDWLNTAIKGGRIHQGYFQYQGSLNSDSPDIAHTLSLYFDLSEIDLDYQKGWPRLQAGRGEVFVEDKGTFVRLPEGRILNSKVRDATAWIAQTSDQPIHLIIKGQVQGRVADALSILRAAPLEAEDIFNTWQGDGLLDAQLDLDIPLTGQAEPWVVVDFSTQGATLVMAQPNLRLEQLSGKFRYDSNKGVSASAMEAKVLGGRVNARLIEAGHAGDPIGRIEAWGDVSAQELSKWLGLGQSLPVRGQFPFQLTLTLADQDSQLLIDSSLEGLALDLPAPFGKTARSRRDTSLRMTLHGRERRYWVQYADLASLSFAAPPDSLDRGRGELRLGAGSARLPPTAGLQVQGTLATLDVDDWQRWLKRFGVTDQLMQASNAASSGADQNVLLNSVTVKVGRFTGFGMDIDNLGVSLKRQTQAWQLGVSSDQITGQLLRPDAKGQPLNLNVQYVRLPATTAPVITTSSRDPLADFDPKVIPAVDIQIQEVWQGQDSLGRWALKLRPTEQGVNFNDVSVNLKGLKVEGNGGWNTGRSWYRGRVQGKNLADVLKAWGFAPSASSEHFQVDIDGHWPGSPAALEAKNFSGLFRAHLQKGQFAELDTQALRVFGLLNFEAIGRRLRLDFTDLVGKGLSYDEVKGQLTATNGVYRTSRPVTLKGPSTDIELDGILDLAHERIDARLMVTLPVTGNLPLAAVIVGAPVVGGAVWAVDKLLGNRVSRLATVQYRVKGPWLEPDITFDKPFTKPRS